MSFAKKLRLDARILSWLSIVALIAATMLPALLNNTQVNAAEIDNRQVTLSTSQSGATDVTYSVSFDTGSAGNVDAMVIQYCDGSPIIGDATCANTRSFQWYNSAATDLALANQAGITDWTVDTTNTTATTLILTRSGAPNAGDPGSGTTISFDIGSTGNSDGVTNPGTDNSAFYLRILTYGTTGGAQAYTPGTPGSHVDDGGIALSTAEQIDISARVQERLTFCVGTANPTAACGGVSGNTVDLGVLGTGINYASTESQIAYAQVSTNAAHGATLSYIADHLKVGATACVDNDADKSVNDVKTDQCLNYETDADVLNAEITGGDEQWGLAITGHENDGTETVNQFTADAGPYDYDTADEFSFTPNTATQIASSSSVVDSEQVNIDFAATSSLTTPTGLYQTTVTFIATSKF